MQCGSSEIKMGRLGKQRFIAAIEPWHGNSVVVYTEEGRAWKRRALDLRGHRLRVEDGPAQDWRGPASAHFNVPSPL